MISLEVNVTGGQLGTALANDPEELAYALVTLAEWDGGELGYQAADHLTADDAETVADFLRAMAEQIKPSEVK